MTAIVALMVLDSVLALETATYYPTFFGVVLGLGVEYVHQGDFYLR